MEVRRAPPRLGELLEHGLDGHVCGKTAALGLGKRRRKTWQRCARPDCVVLDAAR